VVIEAGMSVVIFIFGAVCACALIAVSAPASSEASLSRMFMSVFFMGLINRSNASLSLRLGLFLKGAASKGEKLNPHRQLQFRFQSGGD
jgi:hypothetical protein